MFAPLALSIVSLLTGCGPTEEGPTAGLSTEDCIETYSVDRDAALSESAEAAGWDCQRTLGVDAEACDASRFMTEDAALCVLSVAGADVERAEVDADLVFGREDRVLWSVELEHGEVDGITLVETWSLDAIAGDVLDIDVYEYGGGNDCRGTADCG